MTARNRKHRIRITPITVGPREAAAMLGVSRDHLDKHIQHELRWIRRGRRKLVLVSDLREWAERNAARTLEP
jgi:excisionase family DNA binding protein